MSSPANFQVLYEDLDPLPAVEVLLMGHILHNEDLDGTRKLIAKAHAALPQDGVLVRNEALIDDERGSYMFGSLLSLHLLMATSTGSWCAPITWSLPGSKRIRRTALSGTV